MTPDTSSSRESAHVDDTASEPAGGRHGARGDLWAGLDQSTMMSLELLAGIFVWGGAGWLVDGWLGTWPWLFVLGTFVGFGGGLYLVWHRAVRLGQTEQEQPVQGEASRGTPEGKATRGTA